MAKKTIVARPTRPATLSGRFSETMPDSELRPFRDNVAVREEAARRILHNVTALFPEVAIDLVEAALMAAVRHEDEPDQISSKLCHKLRALEPTDLVKVLGELHSEIDLCYEMMVKTWVRMRKITPKYEEGEEVVGSITTDIFETRNIVGSIVDIDRDTAKYLIKSIVDGKLDNYWIEFENVTLRGEELPKETDILNALMALS